MTTKLDTLNSSIGTYNNNAVSNIIENSIQIVLMKANNNSYSGIVLTSGMFYTSIGVAGYGLPIYFSYLYNGVDKKYALFVPESVSQNNNA